MLKARYYNFAPPLAIWRKLLHTSNLAKTMHQKTVYFRAPDAKFLLPWERRHPSHILPLSVALLPRSSPRRSAHPDFRIPRKISSYGPAYTCLQIICYFSRCSVLNSRWTSHLSVVLPSPLFFSPRSRFENLKIRAESFDLMSVAQRLTRNCNKRQKKIHFTRIYQRQ